MANTTSFPLTISILGDGVSTTAVVSVAASPSAASLVSAFNSKGADVSSNILSVVPSGSNITLTFSVAFSGVITVTIGLVYSSIVNAQIQPISHPQLPNLDVLLSTRTKPSDTQITSFVSPQHVIADSGTITAVTAITNALPAGANTIGKVDLLGNAGAILDGATGSAVPANVIYKGARAATANPANASDGNLVGLMADKAGRLVVTHSHVRNLQGHQTTTIAASGTETTIVTAGASGVFNDLCMLVFAGSSTAATVWSLRDSTGGTPLMSVNVPPIGTVAQPVIVKFDPPLAQTTAANNWTIQAGTGTSTGCQVFAHYIKNT
jgi:hypothetical protein